MKKKNRPVFTNILLAVDITTICALCSFQPIQQSDFRPQLSFHYRKWRAWDDAYFDTWLILATSPYSCHVTVIKCYHLDLVSWCHTIFLAFLAFIVEMATVYIYLGYIQWSRPLKLICLIFSKNNRMCHVKKYPQSQLFNSFHDQIVLHSMHSNRLIMMGLTSSHACMFFHFELSHFRQYKNNVIWSILQTANMKN